MNTIGKYFVVLLLAMAPLGIFGITSAHAQTASSHSIQVGGCAEEQVFVSYFSGNETTCLNPGQRVEFPGTTQICSGASIIAQWEDFDGRTGVVESGRCMNFNQPGTDLNITVFFNE